MRTCGYGLGQTTVPSATPCQESSRNTVAHVVQRRSHVNRSWRLGLAALVLSACGHQSGSGPPRADGGGAGAGGSSGASGATTGGNAGSGTGGSGGGPTGSVCSSTLDANAACAQYGASFCAYFSECAPEFLRDFASNTTCVERTRLRCMVELDAPGNRVQPAFYVAAAEIYDGASCEPVYSFKNPLSGLLEDSSACGQAGALPDGSACYADQQCAGMICKVPKGAPCGTCASLGQLGDACKVDADCSDAHYCTNLKCTARLDVGQSCGATPQCGTDAHCSGGSCKPRLDAGGTCKVDSDCMSGLVCGATKHCKKPNLGTSGASCDPTELLSCNGFQGFDCVNGSCAKSVKPTVGQPCGLQGSSFVDCGGAATCILLPDFTGTCAALAKEPASCNSDTGPECLEPAVCVAGTCTVPAGGMCS